MFQRYVASVSYGSRSGCCNCLYRYVASIYFQCFIYFSDVCCKCVYLDLAYVSHICCKCIIWMLRMFCYGFECFSCVLCKCFIYLFFICCKYCTWQNHPNYAGPRVPVIVLKTSNCCTQKPDNPVVCRVSSGNPESFTFYNSYRINNRVTTTLQHLLQN
jgi:hypothetical protein